MSKKNDSIEARLMNHTGSAIAAEEVKDYLCRHPELLTNDPDLIARLVPPSRATGHNVVDMQHFMISRLQNQVRILRDIQSELIEASSLNNLAQEQVHAATLKLLDSPSFEHMIEFITSPDGLARLLDIRAAAICIETEHGVSGIGTGGLRVLEPGGVDRILGFGTRCRLAANVKGSRGLYGSHADEVHSEALVRLTFSPDAPPGILALGGYEPDQFHPDQAVDLLEFIANVVERQTRQWLGLQPAR